MSYKFTYNANLKKSFLNDVDPITPRKTIQYKIIRVLLVLIILISLSIFLLSRAIDHRLGAIVTPAALMSNLPKDKALPANPNTQNNISSSKISKLISSLFDNKQNSTTSNYEQLNLLRLILNCMVITAILLTLFLTYFINKKLRRNLQQLQAYHDQLTEENTWLETHVQERTVELEEATKHAQKERQRVEFLLQDASHRIGNSLATASSLLSIQINNSKNTEVKSALTVARDHIQTIATAHRRLRLSEDMDTADCKEFFETIIKDIQLSLPPQKRANITINYQIERLKMSARDATTLAIIAGELITNAVKHAFPLVKKGIITVKLAQGKEKVSLIVEDNGKGFPPNITQNNGLGHLIISKLSMQFDAKPTFKNLKNGGARVTLSIKNIKQNLTDNIA